MIHKVSEIKGFRVLARDGEIGNVHDVYFDDERWIVRYLVDDTGGWFRKHLVLVPPAVLGEVDWKEKAVHVSLTRAEVEDCKPRDEDRPVEKQEDTMPEAQLWLWPHQGVPLTSGMAIGSGAGSLGPIAPIPVEEARERQMPVEQDRGDPHLRSVKHVLGYRIHATDGEIGHVEDFLFSDSDWTIRYIVIDTANWWPGKNVLVAPEWIERFGVAGREVDIRFPRETVKSAPEYDGTSPLLEEYESKLVQYYKSGKR